MIIPYTISRTALSSTNQWGDYNHRSCQRESTELRYQGGIKGVRFSPTLQKEPCSTVLEPERDLDEGDDGGRHHRLCKDQSPRQHLHRDPDQRLHCGRIFRILKDFSINLGWHQVTNSSANANIANVLSNTKGTQCHLSDLVLHLKDTNGGIGSPGKF